MTEILSLAQQTIPLLEKLGNLAHTINALSESGDTENVATYKKQYEGALAELADPLLDYLTPIIREVERVYDFIVSFECKLQHDQSPTNADGHTLYVCFRGIVENRTCAPPELCYVMIFAQELARVLNIVLEQEGVPAYLYIAFDSSVWSNKEC